jgi:hypothetical protein
MKQTQLLTEALFYAIIAPDDEKTQRAIKLAEEFSQGLEAADVEKCKARALRQVKQFGKYKMRGVGI